MKRIVVTGANGVVGSFLVEQLLQTGYLVTAVVRSHSDVRSLPAHPNLLLEPIGMEDVDALIKVFEPAQLVIHAAAVVSFNPARKKELTSVNIGGTRNVVNACLNCPEIRLIQISSVAALGRNPGSDVIDESNKWTESPLNSIYGESKYYAELEVYRGIEEGLQAVIVNPSVVLAPGDWTRSSSKLFRYGWEERRFYTEGLINVVDIRDVTKAILQLVASPVSGERYILNGGALTYKKFFEVMAGTFGKRPPNLKVGGIWLKLAAWYEWGRSRIFNQEPLITSETVRLATTYFTYSSEKIKRELNFDFQPVEKSIEWVCREYMKKMMG